MADDPAATNAAAQPNATTPDRRFFWLTVFEYVLIATVTIIFVLTIVLKLNNLGDLADMETARGLITFVITVGTVAIAIMLALTAVLIRDFDKRLVVGKEILTTLIAVLGTIVGFYYGAATKVAEANPGTKPTISVAAPTLNRASDGSLTLTANITGGAPQYTYSIKYSPETIKPVENQTTAGPISAKIELPNPAPTEITVFIQVKDKNGAEFTPSKEGIKLPVPQK